MRIIPWQVRALALAMLIQAPAVVYAQDRESEPNNSEVVVDKQAQTSTEPAYKSGYSRRPVFGGPNSPEGQLEDNDRIREPAFRFPAIDEAFQPWRDWKKDLNDEHGIQFSGHYATLYQSLSDSIGTEDKASSGVFRANGKWTLIGRGTKDTGSLVATIDHRHAFRDIPPSALASEAGYIGVTGTMYSDIDWAVVNLNWQQGFNDGNAGLIVGRYDPNDYMNILGYVNPWTTFQNVSILLDSTVAYPDASWGIGGGTWIQQQWYVIGGINDANGTLADDLEFFDGGSELFTWGEVGWSPSQSERYFKNINLTAWNVDRREDLGIDSSEGIALAANWTFDDRFMPFARAGWSDGNAPIYNQSATLGFIWKFVFRSDLAGLAINWGDPPADALREQTTIEAFWRFQFAPNFAITPSLQLLIDPALNPTSDKVWVFSLRMRLTL